jgi:hypothetical protein
MFDWTSGERHCSPIYFIGKETACPQIAGGLMFRWSHWVTAWYRSTNRFVLIVTIYLHRLQQESDKTIHLFQRYAALRILAYNHN